MGPDDRGKGTLLFDSRKNRRGKWEDGGCAGRSIIREETVDTGEKRAEGQSQGQYDNSRLGSRRRRLGRSNV